MKFMKLGTRPDTFYTEEATRTVISEVPSDLIIQINNISYLLHKLQHQLVPKCGLLQRLCSSKSNPNPNSNSNSDPQDSSPSTVTLELHDIPGGEDGFELCAKFCYGITINFSAHNIVPAFCAAKFLRMTESVEKGNLVLKLEAFFNSCILEGWKDSILTLQTTRILAEWSENLGIIRRCIDSIVEKILTPPSKVTWSYTYTRPGHTKKGNQLAPKDWWTEDISDLEIDLFRCIITAVRSTNTFPPQLIGEALHVYASRWLPDTTKNQTPETSTSSTSQQTRESVDGKQRVLETIVSLIPSDRGSVSIGFLLRLLSVANLIAVSPVTKAELVRRCSLQLEEATVNDLLLPSHSSSSINRHFYDIDLVGAVLESFLLQWRRHNNHHGDQSAASIRRIGKLVDSYLQVAARDVNMPVSKMVALAVALPETARPDHDDLYRVINIYLKEHPDLAKEEKKQLCRVLNCQKLSPEVCAHVVRNERLPLRTVVQVLFFEQGRGATTSTTTSTSHKLPSQELLLRGQRAPSPSVTGDDLSKLKLSSEEQQSREKESLTRTTTTTSGIRERSHHKEETDKGISGSQSDPSKVISQGRPKSDHGHGKRRSG